MDIRSSDGRSLLLKYVSSYVTEMHDHKLLKGWIFFIWSLHKKWTFSSIISSINMTKLPISLHLLKKSFIENSCRNRLSNNFQICFKALIQRPHILQLLYIVYSRKNFYIYIYIYMPFSKSNNFSYMNDNLILCPYFFAITF